MKDIVADTVYEVYRHIEWERIGSSRAMNIWGEMTTKTKRAAKAHDVSRFVSNLCRYWDVKGLGDVELLSKLEALTQDEQAEFLRIAREETEYIVWLVRAKRDAQKAEKAKEKAKKKTIGGII